MKQFTPSCFPNCATKLTERTQLIQQEAGTELSKELDFGLHPEGQKSQAELVFLIWEHDLAGAIFNYLRKSKTGTGQRTGVIYLPSVF